MSWVMFFFQGEEGIRDWSVTGVQTCALPIYRSVDDRSPAEAIELALVDDGVDAYRKLERSMLVVHDGCAHIRNVQIHRIAERSEERRVGKESRTRWCAYEYYKKRVREEAQAS